MATKTLTAAGLAAALLTAVGACSSGTGAGGDSTTVKVGLVNSYTGALASFGPAWEEGYRAGLKVSTSGSMTVGGVKIEIEKKNDNSNPATGLSAAKQLLGDGAKVIVGPASSAVVVPVAQLAMQNKAVFIAARPAPPTSTAWARASSAAPRRRRSSTPPSWSPPRRPATSRCCTSARTTPTARAR
ncbi:ABC transporter substrate-binding protein [Actinomadura madurae]|uniref:ABC transporter substrate-binding protein n=1 Tax=Actinomadura madurae TaxID=1993 RepID=UPI0020D25D4D|nr:ABC transporter substrate-binding protein [Actinomadura madurae]MCP9968694.1 ABC transporter substrate-binding protein [Actinomadura madurae]